MVLLQLVVVLLIKVKRWKSIHRDCAGDIDRRMWVVERISVEACQHMEASARAWAEGKVRVAGIVDSCDLLRLGIARVREVSM